MCILIVSTIFLSVVYSLFFFLALLALIGPEGEDGNVGAVWRSLRARCRRAAPHSDAAREQAGRDSATE